ncbi:MAG: T9SS type A sorting domain-containing protein [Bacteroidota bacterium]
MKTMYKHVWLVVALTAVVCSASPGQITSKGSGDWSSTTPDAPWPGGVVPGPTDNIVVADGHTVTINTTEAECNNLTIGTTGGSNTTVRWRVGSEKGGLTVNGNIVLAFPNSRLRVESRSPAGAANTFVEHDLLLYGDLDNSAGGIVDFRAGSNASGTSNGVLLSLTGDGNSTITLNQSTYASSTEEFNSITVNKTSGATVILAGGNLFMSNNTSVGATILTLTEGLIETGSQNWVLLSTNAAGIVGASDSSYVLGNLGRGMSNSSSATRTFHVGDADGYRPLTLSSTTSGSATGHHTVVAVVTGNANTGSSTLTGGIDRVSKIRYFKVTYVAGAGAASMSYNYFAPSYRSDDRVTQGNFDLRVAYSADERATWNGINDTAQDSTDLTAPPTATTPDSLGTAVTLNAGAAAYVALARATGTTTNSLTPPPSIVRHVYPRFVGSVGNPATLENPVAYYFTISDLQPNTQHDGLHMGFIGTSAPATTRGSKWRADLGSWVSPSTAVSPFGTTDADGVLQSWVALRPPTNFLAEPYRVRIRVRQTGLTEQLTFDSPFDIVALVFASSATGPTAGAVVYGYTDTVSQNNGGYIMLAYETLTDKQPMAAWLIQRSSGEESELFTTRSDTLYRSNGYFQLLIPANTPVAKLEVRDSTNALVRSQTSTAWKSGDPGSQTNLNTLDNIVLSVERISDYVPQSFVVSQNYPNPFNPSTSIRFSLSKAGLVKLKVYDTVGREVATLIDDQLAAGTYHVRWNASGFASGAYFYSIESSGVRETKKMVLLR